MAEIKDWSGKWECLISEYANGWATQRHSVKNVIQAFPLTLRLYFAALVHPHWSKWQVTKCQNNTGNDLGVPRPAPAWKQHPYCCFFSFICHSSIEKNNVSGTFYTIGVPSKSPIIEYLPLCVVVFFFLLLTKTKNLFFFFCQAWFNIENKWT